MIFINRIKHKIKYLFLPSPPLPYSPKVDIHLKTATHGTEYGQNTIYPANINQDSIIYSFGVGEDVSFDISLIQSYGCSVYAFDPTPKSIIWVKNENLPSDLYFYPYGVGARDEIATFYPPDNPEHVSHTIVQKETTANQAIDVPMKRLKTILNELGHTHIDLLKLDIEGAEFEVLADILQSSIVIKQLLVEFHHGTYGISEEATKDCIHALKANGFRCFHVWNRGHGCSFIHESAILS